MPECSSSQATISVHPGFHSFELVNLSELVVGRNTTSPIYDSHGILLLAENSPITSEVKQNLKQRGIQQIAVSPEDLQRITVKKLQRNEQTQILRFDTELTRKIDAIIDGGLAGVKNTGPAVKEKLVFLGKKGYSQQQRGRLLEGHKENSKALGSMISDAIHGTLSDGAPVAKMAANYLQEMTTDTDNVLTSTIGLFEEEDLATRSIEVSVLSMAIGIEMGLDQENCYRLAITGLVHDWGMMKVPEEIRSAVHKINVIEQLEIHKHPIHSMELLQRVSSLPSVVSVISYQVHERMNGTGYPRGRRGKSIHQLARMLQVADEYVELTSPIRKRRPVMRYKAMEHLIYQAKQNRIDGEVVKALLKVQSLFPLGSYVTLSDGSIAQVLRRNRDHFAEPIVCRVQNSSGHEVAPNDPENIIDLHESQDLKVIQALPTPGSDETDEIPESVMPDGN